jgi:replication-associated recombination protein RarA
MIPKTLHQKDPFVYLSTMQKAIRRGEERLAMEAACEVAHSSKPFFSMVCNRLEVIMHEDIGLADMPAVQFAATAIEQARRHFDAEKPGKWRMMVGNAIRALCRASKSREGDHLQAVCGVPNLEWGVVPEVPEYAYDMHTRVGRKQGRGLDHFRESSCALVPSPKPDQYEDEAYEIWHYKHNGTQPGRYAEPAE